MRDRSRRIPLTVWAVTALHVGLLLVFSVLYPPFTAFDEPQHVDAVLSIRHGDGWPAPQERQLSEGIVAVATPVLRAATALPFTDDPVPPRDERPSVASLGVERDAVGQPLPNQITQHPPLYYGVEAAVLAVVPGSRDWPYDRTVAVLRLLSVLMMAPLPLLAWATARALQASPLVGVTAAVLSVSVPQLQRVGASVNNDAGYVLGFSVAVLLLTRIAMGDLRRRTVVVAGIAVGLALLTKGFALVLPLTVVAAFLAGGRAAARSPVRQAPWWRAGLLCLVVAFLVGGWWWLRNLLVYGAVQPPGWSIEAYRRVLGTVPRPEGTPAPLSDFVAGTYARLSERFWGGLGINYGGGDTYPDLLIHVLVAGTVIGLVAAVVGARRGRLAVLAAVLVPLGATLGIVCYGIWSGYTYSLDFPGAQGRYLFGSVTGLAAAGALGLSVLAGPARRVLPVLAALLALVLQSAGIVSVVRHAWLPLYDGRPRLERYRDAFDGILRWSPWPPEVTGTLFALTPLVGAVVLLLAARWAFVRDEVAPVSVPAAEPVPDRV